MVISTDVTIEIDSRRCGKTYELLRFTEFKTDLDLETDADGFDMVAQNVRGLYTGLFCRFDNCRIKVNGSTILEGNIDDVIYYVDENDNYIRFTGRDLCWKLVDNDALPDTLESVQPKSYIESKCAEYGIKCEASTCDIYDQLVIGCQESEISIMNNIVTDGKQRIWYEVDTLKTGSWATNSSPSYVFAIRGDDNSIPIKYIKLTESGTDMISKLLIYGTDDDGNHIVNGEYDNKYMQQKGIKKRSVRRAYSQKASSRYTSVAEKDVRDNFRDDTELEITCALDDKHVFMPNRTAQVLINQLNVNCLFFIKSVSYTKDIDNGSMVTLRMIPSDPTFETLWNSSTGITVTNFTEASKQLANANVTNVYKTESIGISTTSNVGGEYFPACTGYTGVSIVDGLKSVGANSAYSYRKTIAEKNNISGYKGTAGQNTNMLNLLKAGKLLKP